MNASYELAKLQMLDHLEAVERQQQPTPPPRDIRMLEGTLEPDERYVIAVISDCRVRETWFYRNPEGIASDFQITLKEAKAICAGNQKLRNELGIIYVVPYRHFEPEARASAGAYEARIFKNPDLPKLSFEEGDVVALKKFGQLGTVKQITEVLDASGFEKYRGWQIEVACSDSIIKKLEPTDEISVYLDGIVELSVFNAISLEGKDVSSRIKVSYVLTPEPETDEPEPETNVSEPDAETDSNTEAEDDDDGEWEYIRY